MVGEHLPLRLLRAHRSQPFVSSFDGRREPCCNTSNKHPKASTMACRGDRGCLHPKCQRAVASCKVQRCRRRPGGRDRRFYRPVIRQGLRRRYDHRRSTACRTVVVADPHWSSSRSTRTVRSTIMAHSLGNGSPVRAYQRADGPGRRDGSADWARVKLVQAPKAMSPSTATRTPTAHAPCVTTCRPSGRWAHRCGRCWRQAAAKEWGCADVGEVKVDRARGDARRIRQETCGLRRSRRRRRWRMPAAGLSRTLEFKNESPSSAISARVNVQIYDHPRHHHQVRLIYGADVHARRA